MRLPVLAGAMRGCFYWSSDREGKERKKAQKKRIWDEASACIWFWIKESRMNGQSGLNLKAEAATVLF